MTEDDVETPPETSPLLPGEWLEYRAQAELHDEVFGAGGILRPVWVQFLEAIRELGEAEFARRWQDAQHLIRENGVTYNVYGDLRGMERPWRLDPVPLLISSREFRFLDEALVQRAHVLEALGRDLYGPQRCLKEGVLPPELVFGNPGFLRACHGTAWPRGRMLHLYAANVGRTPGGEFVVLGDRTQAPSGAGYALENRLVMSRVLPEAFRECRVQRLAMFFRTLQDTLRSIAPRHRDHPRIVLLTPGPYNETYFEHAYLARYLGYTLVEGGDLTVRDQQVYLKMLGELQPVDVIFRRLDDDYCDPLELRPDSFLGVTGLVQAVHAGTVAVANALGSGVLESPGLLAYLPQLCRFYFGEELRLCNVKTWWCGDPSSCEFVLEHLPHLVIKPSLAGGRREAVIGNELSAAERLALAAEIRARPHAFVGEERVPLSTAPVLGVAKDRRLEPRHFVLRTYLAAHEDSFVVMPGGLSRVSASPHSMVVSMRRGGGSKDTWVQADGPIPPLSLLKPSGQPLEITRGGSDLPSRVADNLYWLGRYAERAEGLTRLLRGVLVRLTETSGVLDAPELAPLLRSITLVSECHPGFVGDGAEVHFSAPDDELRAVIHDARREGSLAATVNRLWLVAGMVRDRISTDMWRVLGDLAPLRGETCSVAGSSTTPQRTPLPQLRTLSDELELLDRVVITLAAFGGLAMESMTRGAGWRFLDMGRKLERALHTIRLLHSTLVTATHSEGPLLEALLQVADSSMTYRRRYQGSVQTAAVLDLLLFDETNPRSVLFQFAALADDVNELPNPPHPQPRLRPERRLIVSALTQLRLADPEALAQPDASGTRGALQELLSSLNTALPTLSDELTHTYLSHLQVARHLSHA